MLSRHSHIVSFCATIAGTSEENAVLVIPVIPVPIFGSWAQPKI